MVHYFLTFISGKGRRICLFCISDFPELASQGDDLDDCMGMGAGCACCVVEEYTKSKA